MTKLEYYFDLFSKQNFPSYDMSDDRYHKLYNNLVCSTKVSPRSNCAMDIVVSGHPSVWDANVYGHISPRQAWYTPKFLLRCIGNRLDYIGDNLTAEHIVAGFSIAKIAPRVSLFKPMLAKYLVQKYLSEYCEIFDPCAGYSGRMLGVCASGKKYIGQDCNWQTIKESSIIRDRLGLNAVLLSKNSIYDSGIAECLFTCPPYMNCFGSMIERWNEDIEPLSEDEWIDTCLKNYKCKKYLFVVGHTEKYKSNIVEEISNKSHFGNKIEYVVLI